MSEGEQSVVIKSTSKNFPLVAENCSPFSEKELEVINQLRARLSDMRGDAIAEDFLSDDSVMWRFYTAHADGLCPGPENQIEGVLDAASKMFRVSVKWRKAIKIDDMWKRWRNERSVEKRSKFVQLGSYVFYGQGHIPEDSVTVDGGPLIYERLGKVDLDGIAADNEVRDSVREAYIMSLESAWRAVRKIGGKMRAVMVVDLKSLGWSFMRNRGFIEDLTGIGPPHYPEIVQTVLVVQAPWIIKAAFKLVGPLLPKRTREKVIITLITQATCTGISQSFSLFC